MAVFAAPPLYSPDYVKIAEAYGLAAACISSRADVIPAVQAARARQGTTVLEFRVEQEDTVYPMVPAGADLHDMIRRPSPLVETAEDA
jgi:acetolactate synthase I/II/III large subunit